MLGWHILIGSGGFRGLLSPHGSPDSSVPDKLLPRYFHKGGPATAQCGVVFHVDGTYRSSNVREHVNINRAFFPKLNILQHQQITGHCKLDSLLCRLCLLGQGHIPPLRKAVAEDFVTPRSPLLLA